MDFSRRLLGYLLLAGVNVLWVGSSVFIQFIYHDYHFDKPLLVTLLQTSLSVLLMGPCALRRWFSQRRRDKLTRLGMADILREEDECRSPYEESEGMPAHQIRKLAAMLSIVWLGAQLFFNESLHNTSVASVTVISATSSFWTYFLSIFILREHFKTSTFISIVVAFAGVCMISVYKPDANLHYISSAAIKSKMASVSSNNSSSPSSFSGYVLATISAVFYSIFTVFLKKGDPECRGIDMGFFFGWIGIVITLLSPPLLMLGHITGFETFAVPSWRTLGCLVLNGLIGTVLSDFLWAAAVLLLNPLIATVGVSLSIPLSILIDFFVLRQHKFTWVYLVGSLLVFCGVVAVAITWDIEQTRASSNLGNTASSNDGGDISARSIRHDRPKKVKLIEHNKFTKILVNGSSSSTLKLYSSNNNNELCSCPAMEVDSSAAIPLLTELSLGSYKSF